MKLSQNKKTKMLFASTFFFLSIFSTRHVVAAGFDALKFKPATDQGYYLTVEQSKTLGTMGHAIGFTGDYSSNSLVLRNAAGAQIQQVIQKQVALNLGAALGVTPWLQVGANVGGVPYQEFVTPGTLLQDNGARFGDIGVNLKAQIIDSEKNLFGVAVVPFITFPTGNDNHFTGEGNVTGGGKLVIDTKRLGDRVSFAVNAGGQARKDVTLTPGARTVGDQFLYGAAVNVEIAKPLQFIAEVSGSTEFNHFFADNNRDLEIDGALRLLPEEKRNWLITAGGGAGLQQGAGTPDYRIFASVAMRFPKVDAETHTVTPEPIREEVISTSNIHFAFNKSVIKASSYPILNQILADIQSRPEIQRVRVEGHTDHVGSDEYNQKLSEERASSVRVYLVKQGYPSDKIHAVGAGETNPIDDNTTKSGRAKNRRVEFHLQLPGDSNVKVQKNIDTSPTYEEGDRNR